jgi:threonylcarbamoyladenosine tRNA methylthiotransferase CDKAL1
LVSGAIKRGAREIQLTAQDTGNYGSDISTDLPSLIGRVSLIPGDFRIRIGMFNPSSIIPLLDPLISSYASRKVYKFAHIPLQSGSRAILQSMDRRYTPDAFLSIVKSFRAAYPSISLATDIIVGYPGETEDDFSDTFALLAEAHPDKTHIARFSPRPHTPAASLKQVPEPLKKKRSSAIVRLKREIQLENNSHWIGRTVDATVLDMRGSLMVARTDEYKPVSIAGCGRLPMLGERVSLAIESCTPYSLAGSINRR